MIHLLCCIPNILLECCNVFTFETVYSALGILYIVVYTEVLSELVNHNVYFLRLECILWSELALLHWWSMYLNFVLYSLDIDSILYTEA